MRKWILLLTLCGSAFQVGAQSPVLLRQSMGSAGASRSTVLDGRPVRVQQSVGQGSVIGTWHHDGTVVHQGFIQPLGTAVASSKELPLSVTVFPNPFDAAIRLHFDVLPEAPVELELIDLSGRHVWASTKAPEQEMYAALPTLAAGPYQLRVRCGKRLTTIHLQHLPRP